MLLLRLIFACLLLPLIAAAETRTVQQTNRHQLEIAVELKAQIKTLIKEGDKVRIVTNGKYGLSTRSNPPWRTDFSLPLGGMFEKKPEAQKWQTFRIKGISEQSISLEYEYGFNHRSADNDLLVIDKGQLEMPLSN
ncbi:MAG: hypothetical protein IT292_05285 [Deltaproteobacteria bacterium]|nr:hypothetical protein [Deltaproteobacteria bacterium]